MDEKDFFLASQLPIIPLNETTENLMKIIAEGELKGANSTNDTQQMQNSRNGLEPI